MICLIPFGSYVQVHTKPDPKNTQYPRTFDCIYLRYVDNNQGNLHLLYLQTGRTIKGQTITTIPITEHIIDLVHKMVEHNNMKTGLKIETRSDTVLYDSAWIAGADYDVIKKMKKIKKTVTKMKVLQKTQKLTS
jgi:hypothetical protein